MKSKPNAVLLLAALLIAAVAGAVGWIGRGLFTGRASSQSATAPPTAETSRTGSSSAVSSTSQRSGAVSSEEPKIVAKRLLQAMLDDTQGEGSGELVRFRFQQALAGCDEAAVAEMLEIFMRFAKDPTNRVLGKRVFPRDLSSLLMTQMAAFNPQKALDCQVGLEEAGIRGGPGSFSLAMEMLAEQDPAYAQKVIEGLPPGYIRTSAQMAWWQARSKADPGGVFQFLMNLDDDARDRLPSYPSQLRGLLFSLALQAPEKALQAAAHLPENSISSVQEDLARYWINRDPTAAVQWALEQNDAKSLMMCLGALPSDDRALVEKSIRDNFSSITSTEHAVRVSLAHDLAAHLAAQDVPEALRWVATLPAAEQTAANVPVVEAWMRKDAAAAAEWLTTWPAGKSRDEAVGRLVESIRTDDPEGALTWAASMQSPHRWTQMQLALGYLDAKDPAAAERALNTLSEEDRAVLSAIQRHGADLR